MKRDLYEEVTAKILAQLEAGVIPWQKPWDSAGIGGFPINAITRKPYRGINVLILACSAPAAGNGWATYKQWDEIGSHVKKGEKGTTIVFFKPWTVEDKATGKDKTVPVLRAFTVFHSSQVDPLPECLQPKPVAELPEHERIANCEAMLALARVIEAPSDRAFYRLDTDEIHLPKIGQFPNAGHYYATGLHELTHWTMHKDRCDREAKFKRFGDTAYAREELVAEMGSAFLCAHAGIEGKMQHASYLASWIKVLKEDSKAIVVAAGAAQKAADWVLGKAFPVETTEHPE